MPILLQPKLKICQKEVMNKLVIAGAQSGMGKYLIEKMRGISLHRDFSEESWKNLEMEGIETIIHCAHNSTYSISSENLYTYMVDNVFLTERLLRIPHQKFIYFSSVDVYSQNNNNVKHDEGEIITIDKTHSFYALTKLISESLVKKHGKKWIILRPTNLLGKDSRKSSNVQKLLNDKNPQLSLTSDSEWNFILHKDVRKFVEICLQKDYTGIYNLGSSSNIRVSEVADFLKKNPIYSSFKYVINRVDTAKAVKVLPAFSRNSIDVIKEYVSK